MHSTVKDEGVSEAVAFLISRGYVLNRHFTVETAVLAAAAVILEREFGRHE